MLCELSHNTERTGEVKNIDYLVKMQYSAGKPWFPTFTWVET